MNESNGMPASLGAHCEMMIGFDLEGRLAASTSSKAARHQMKRERVLRNILIALILSIQYSLSKMVYRTHRQRKLWPKIVLAIDRACPGAILHHISRADSRSYRSMWRVAGVHCGEGGVTSYFSVVSSWSTSQQKHRDHLSKRNCATQFRRKEWHSAQCAPDSPTSTFRHQHRLSRLSNTQVPRRAPRSTETMIFIIAMPCPLHTAAFELHHEGVGQS